MDSHLSRRQFLGSAAFVLGGAMLPAISRASEGGIALKSAEPWAPHPKAAPVTEKRGDIFAIDSNGTRTCSGGWQWHYEGIAPGQTYEIATEATHHGLSVPRDALMCIAIWGTMKPDQERPSSYWDYLLPHASAPERTKFSRTLIAPADANQITIRAALRWTASGKTIWTAPRVAVAAKPLTKRPPVRVCVVTGQTASRQPRFKTIKDSITFYGDLCETACRECHPQMIVLPEIALQWGVPGDSLDLAVPVPGPETDAFAAIARKHHVRVAIGMYERNGDAFHNSVILVSPKGEVDGRYRKVHLAAGGEDISGVLPGDGFPVFNTEVGRIGCNICMDTSAAESSRMVGLNGAEFLLMPIMGDHRADRWSRGTPIFSEDRWRAIMRTHAIDNQLCMVVARNNALGSCIVDRKGELLAWNDGDKPFIFADVTLDDDYRIWQGGCFRDVNWIQRRPGLYGPFVDPANFGGSK